MEIDLLSWLHVIGATVLLGTGAGIAFFMTMAHSTGNPVVIAHVARTVVIADLIFTATAIVAQPITGLLLASQLGWSWTEGWIVASVGLYILTGCFWLPVVWIQVRLRDMAQQAASTGQTLPARYYRLYRIWIACGFPAFASVLAILWLMLTKPHLAML